MNPEQNGYSRTPADLPPGMSGETARPPVGGTKPATPTDSESTGSQSEGDAWALQQARHIYVSSANYKQQNVTNQWERNLLHFRNQHAPGAPYSRSDWKRSRTFRPKTRANVKAQEASAAAAIFSTRDIASFTARNPNDDENVACAEVVKEIVNYRLEETPLSWFLTVVGAFQDTKIYGVCVSHQYWKYETHTSIVPAYDEMDNPIMGKETDAETGEERDVPMGITKKTVLEDQLCVDLVEPENFGFDPMCDWRNPARTSPYIMYMKPIHAADALAQMDEAHPVYGKHPWRKYSLQQILSTRREIDNRTRRAREGYDRIDPVNDQSGNPFTMVWAHLNIQRVDGEDVAWWTMGTDLVLSDVVPLREMYPWLKPGERPFVVGFSTLEAHRNYPAGDVEQAAPLQEEINAVANQRLDNVKLVLNKRYFVRRGSQVDLDALVRNVPGGGVMVNDPDKDIVTVDTRDVTGSAYQEHDRLATEFDELVGGFSNSSVLNNRQLNETVGGMDRIASSAGAVQDYGIKIFFETWLGPVLRQITRLEQLYETDKVVIALAADKSTAFKRLGRDEATDELLTRELIVEIDVGLGNTDPMTYVQKLVYGLSQVGSMPGMQDRIKPEPVADAVFGALGFHSSKRFFLTEKEAAEKAQQNPPQIPPEIQVKMRELEIRQDDNNKRHEKEQKELELKREVAYAELALKQQLTLEQMYVKLGIEKAKNDTTRDSKALDAHLKISEHNLKRTEIKNQPQKPSGGKPPQKGGSNAGQ